MPKRTNAFQSLVAQLYQARKEDQSLVVESTNVSERGTDTPAEIDILITKQTFGSAIRIALECRDHRRPQTVQWIRELADKRHSMGIDKVFAVSTSGFTATARAKAADSGIELLTLEQAESLDFGGQAIRLGMRQVAWRIVFHALQIEFTDAPTVPVVTPRVLLWRADGKAMCTIDDLVRDVMKSRASDVKAEFDRAMPSVYKTLGDIGKEAILEMPIYFNQEIRLGGALVRAVRVLFRCTPSSLDVPLSHYRLGGISFARGVVQAGGGELSMMASHWADRPGEISVSTRRVDGVPGGAHIPGAAAKKKGKRRARQGKK